MNHRLQTHHILEVPCMWLCCPNRPFQSPNLRYVNGRWQALDGGDMQRYSSVATYVLMRARPVALVHVAGDAERPGDLAANS